MAKNINHGKFYKDDNGSWRIDTRININGKYYHIQKRGFATKHEAQAAYPSIVEQKIKECSKGNRESEIAFEQFIISFEKFRSLKCCKATTATNDFYLTKKFLTPTFGGLSISEAFSPKHFLPWYDDLASNTHISVPRRNKAIRLAKGMLQFAYSRKMIGADAYQDCDVVCIALKEPHRQEKKRVLWSKEEKSAFLSAINPDTADYVMFSLLLETAPRIGEFLGLTPECFNAEQGYIEIKQQVIYENDNCPVLTDRLKSYQSYRKIPLSPAMAALLNRYISALEIKPKEFLFGPWGSHTTPLSRTEFRRKLTAYCKAAGVPSVSPHAFRHMLSTALSSHYTSTAEIEAGAAMLGHSTGVELNIYCHNNTLEKARDLIDRLA